MQEKLPRESHAAHSEDFAGDDTLVPQLIEDFRQAAITDADKAMLEYAAKLTIEPWNMVKADGRLF